MITQLSLIKKSKKNNPTMHAWAYESPLFKTMKKVKFHPGLNVIFGPNGSGKSTALSLLAHHLAAEQGGRSVVTQRWLMNLTEFHNSSRKTASKVVHDGSPVIYVSPRRSVGLDHGHFDDDFFGEGLRATLERGSDGELAAEKMGLVMELLLGKIEGNPEAKFPHQIEWKIERQRANEIWQKKFDAADDLLRPSIEPGPSTFLLDEPELGFGIPWQARLWKLFDSADPTKWQLIVASHSPFALSCKHAHFIEPVPGYVEECREWIQNSLQHDANGR